MHKNDGILIRWNDMIQKGAVLMSRTNPSVPLRFLLFLLIFALISYAFSYVASREQHDDDVLQATPSSSPFPFTVVLDAGHGGEDGGAVSASGLYEKDLNLQVAQLLCELLEANGVKVVMTRTTDTLLYDRNVDYQGRKKALDLAARREIAEQTPNALFVSIHMNAFPKTQYHGLQVWYSPNHGESRHVAEEIRATVQEGLQPENDRQIKEATSSIYLLHHLSCPAVLIECGFLSNPAEAERLGDTIYQKELAFLLFLAIMESQA